jgi:RHS repeat-associated protein
LYDNEDSVCGIVYNDEPYYFQKNLQGDVIAITDKDGEVVANYTYDAWGKLTSITGTAFRIALLNPFRYRGYYYDEETELYYLQSRYYDPEVGRFVNADEIGCIVRNTQSEKGNAYSYVFNCPTIKTDESGQFSLKFLAFGIQLAFSFGRINVGLELLWDLKNGKFYPFIYFGSGGSKDINGVMGYVSKCFLAPLKKTSRSVSAILKVLSKLSVAVSAIIVFGSSNRTMPGSYYGWFNCFSLTLKVFWANLILSGAFAKNSNGYIASFGIGLSTDRPLFLKAGYGKSYYIHLNGWSNIKTQLSNLLAPLKSNAASKQKTLQTAAKLAG